MLLRRPSDSACVIALSCRWKQESRRLLVALLVQSERSERNEGVGCLSLEVLAQNGSAFPTAP